MTLHHTTSQAGQGILHFPLYRARPPAWPSGFLDPAGWTGCMIVANVADQFRRRDPGEAEAAVAAIIAESGAGAIARMLEHNTVAIATLRAALASLIESDRRIAAAATAVLQREGAPA